MNLRGRNHPQMLSHSQNTSRKLTRLLTLPIVLMVCLRWEILSMTLTLHRSGQSGTLLRKSRKRWPRSILAKKTSYGTTSERHQRRPGHSILRTLRGQDTTRRATSSTLSSLPHLQYQHSIVLHTRPRTHSSQLLLRFLHELLCSNTCRIADHTVTSQRIRQGRPSDPQSTIRTPARTPIHPLRINQT